VSCVRRGIGGIVRLGFQRQFLVSQLRVFQRLLFFG